MRNRPIQTGGNKHINKNIQWWVFITLLLALAGFTWHTGTDNFMYQPLPEQPSYKSLELNPDFWREKAPQGKITYLSDSIELTLPQDSLLRLGLQLPISLKTSEDNVYLRATGNIERISGAVPSDKPLMDHSITFRTLKPENKSGNTRVLYFNSRDPLESLSAVLPASNELSDIRLVVRLNHSGAWRLSDFNIDTVTKKDLYLWSTWLLKAAGLALALCFIVMTVTSAGMVCVVTFLCVLGIATSLMAIGQNTINQALSLLNQYALVLSKKLGAGNPEIFLSSSDSASNNIGHLLIFFLVALVLLLSLRQFRMSLLQALAFLLSMAVLTEAMQRHSLTRSPSWSDLYLDLTGIILAFIFWYLLRTITLYANKLIHSR